MMSENNDSRDIRESSLSREKQELRPAFTRESSIERGAEDDETTVPSSRRRLNTNSSNTKSEDHQQRACEAEDSENIVERINITDADASFILGTGGRTKKKLARVSRAELSVTQTGRDNTVLEIRGPVDAVDRAKTYVEFVMQQRVGPVRLSSEVEERDDLVVLDIPHECVGYVTGSKGRGLRSVEEEFSTLMFFTDVNKERPTEDAPSTEKLVIFSPSQRARQGAVLKVMSAIEQKIPGYFTTGITEKETKTDDFDVDISMVNEEDYSYALGRGGGTRKKLARASGAILEYIGRFAYIAGNKSQRDRARQYLKWLCAQRMGSMQLEDIDKRDDVEQVDVPMDCVAYVTGQRGQALRRMEEQTGTFMFLDGTRQDKGAATEKLYIFGECGDGRARAKQLAEARIDEKITGAFPRRENHRRSSIENNRRPPGRGESVSPDHYYRRPPPGRNEHRPSSYYAERDYHQSSGNEYHHRAAPPTQKRYRGQYDRGQQEYDRGQSDRGHQQYDRDRGGSSYYDRREESSPPPFDNNIRYYGGPSSQRDLSPIRKRHGGSPPPPYDGKPGPRFNGGPRRDYF